MVPARGTPLSGAVEDARGSGLSTPPTSSGLSAQRCVNSVHMTVAFLAARALTKRRAGWRHRPGCLVPTDMRAYQLCPGSMALANSCGPKSSCSSAGAP